MRYLAGYNPAGCYGAVASTIGGVGENVLLGKQRCVKAHMEIRSSDSLVATCQAGHTIFNISAHARVCLF